MRTLYFLATVLVLAAADSALAGTHFDIAAYPLDGKILTGGYDHSVAPPLSSLAERIFAYDFAEEDDDLNSITDPGFINRPGFPSFDVGKALGFEVSLNLQYWNGAGTPSFAPAAAPAQITLSLGILSKQITGAAATGNLQNIATTRDDLGGNIGRLHEHVTSTIASNAPEGIYLIGLTLHMPGLLDSDPIYLVYNDLQTLLLSLDPDDIAKQNASREAAVEWVQGHLINVPEPSTWLLAATALGAMPLIRRRVNATRRRWCDP